MRGKFYHDDRLFLAIDKKKNPKGITLKAICPLTESNNENLLNFLVLL